MNDLPFHWWHECLQCFVQLNSERKIIALTWTIMVLSQSLLSCIIACLTLSPTICSFNWHIMAYQAIIIDCSRSFANWSSHLPPNRIFGKIHWPIAIGFYTTLWRTWFLSTVQIQPLIHNAYTIWSYNIPLVVIYCHNFPVHMVWCLLGALTLTTHEGYLLSFYDQWRALVF